MNRNILYLVALILGLCSCGRNTVPETATATTADLPFTIECKSLKHIPGEGIDSKVGKVVCDGIVLNYDYGRHSYRGPQTSLEQFRQKFFAYYYSQVFDAIDIDEKLRETMKDSIKIVTLYPSKLDQKLINDCTACEATAHLTFQNKDIYFAIDKSAINDGNLASYSKVEIQDLSDIKYQKLYISQGSEKPSGLYIGYKNNPRKNRKLNKLSVIYQGDEYDKTERMLNSVILKEN